MSHWQAGKMKLKCSLSILQRALIKIMPEWKDHIHVDPQGKIPIYTYTGQRLGGDTFHLIVPGKANPNYAKAPHVKYNDIGLKQSPDGTWEIQIDRSGLPQQIHNFEEKVTGRVTEMRAKQNAINMGFRPLGQVEEGGKIIIRMRGKVPEQYKIRG